MLDVARSRRPSRRSSTGRYYTPPTPPKIRTPPPPPPNQRANKRFSRQTWRTSQSCAHVGRNVGHRSHPLQRSNHDMERDTYTARTTASIWAQKKRKTDTDQPQRDIRWLGEPQGWRVYWHVYPNIIILEIYIYTYIYIYVYIKNDWNVSKVSDFLAHWMPGFSSQPLASQEGDRRKWKQEPWM